MGYEGPMGWPGVSWGGNEGPMGCGLVRGRGKELTDAFLGSELGSTPFGIASFELILAVVVRAARAVRAIARLHPRTIADHAVGEDAVASVFRHRADDGIE